MIEENIKDFKNNKDRLITEYLNKLNFIKTDIDSIYEKLVDLFSRFNYNENDLTEKHALSEFINTINGRLYARETEMYDIRMKSEVIYSDILNYASKIKQNLSNMLIQYANNKKTEIDKIINDINNKINSIKESFKSFQSEPKYINNKNIEQFIAKYLDEYMANNKSKKNSEDKFEELEQCTTISCIKDQIKNLQTYSSRNSNHIDKLVDLMSGEIVKIDNSISEIKNKQNNILNIQKKIISDFNNKINEIINQFTNEIFELKKNNEFNSLKYYN